MEKQVYDMEELYEVVNPENKDNPFVITRQCIQNATEYNTEHWSDLRMYEITKIINDEIEMDWNKNLPHFNKFQGEEQTRTIKDLRELSIEDMFDEYYIPYFR